MNTLSPPPFYLTEQYRPGDHKLRIYRSILISFPFSLCLFSKCLFFHNSSPSSFSLTEMTSGVMAFLCSCGNSRGEGWGLWSVSGSLSFCGKNVPCPSCPCPLCWLPLLTFLENLWSGFSWSSLAGQLLLTLHGLPKTWPWTPIWFLTWVMVLETWFSVGWPGEVDQPATSTPLCSSTSHRGAASKFSCHQEPRKFRQPLNTMSSHNPSYFTLKQLLWAAKRAVHIVWPPAFCHPCRGP